MPYYRVKEQNGIFIPQIWRWRYFAWEGISRDGGSHTWLEEYYQKGYCSCDTLEKAIGTINIYKKKSCGKIKIYKIK